MRLPLGRALKSPRSLFSRVSLPFSRAAVSRFQPNKPLDSQIALAEIKSSTHASVYTSTDRRDPIIMPHSPAVVRIPWAGVEGETTDIDDVQTQLQNIPKDTRYLRIDETAPSNDHWALLGAHFTAIENLELESGFEELLNDRNIPLHWPLQRLELRSATSELAQSPFIRQGRVPHLSLLLTCGLRFVGPTSDELQRLHKEDIERGDKKAEYIKVYEGTPEEREIEIIYLPDLVVHYMNKHYCGPDAKEDPENEPPVGPINMKTLEIFENDAIDTFSRMTQALPHIVSNLQTLRISSTSGLDFQYLPEEPFRYILPTMDNLEVFNLTVGEIFQDPSYLPTFYKALPPNLTTLYFRGPTSLCRSEHWPDWLKSFESETFLPKLKQLAFVLDLHYEAKPNKWGRRKTTTPPVEVLRQAREACDRLYSIARKRGINIVNMPVDHDSMSHLFEPVDARW